MKALLVSMEAALESDIPTYAGGLGVLVGDKVRAARDLKLDLDVLTFSYPLGYVKHRIIDEHVAVETNPYEPTKKFKSQGEIKIDGTRVEILRGRNVWLAHTDVAKKLYIEKSPVERLKKEVLLGKVAAHLFGEYDTLHMEESNTAFAGKLVRQAHPKARIVFTTHTPLPYGHEKWDAKTSGKLGFQGEISMTKLALDSADYVNCVSRMQRDVMNPHLDDRADYVTNGIHVGWMHPEIKKLVKSCVGDVDKSPEKLANATCLDIGELREARAKAKTELIEKINSTAFKNDVFENEFTVGIARRFTSYKKLDLVLSEFDTLERMAAEHPLQIVFSGVAHPNDVEGLKTIQKVLLMARKAKHVKIAYFPQYTMDLAKTMIAGSDAWLNVPQEEREASGTSWMKAMMNGTTLISTRSGSVPEYAIHRQNALLTEGSAKELLGNINYAMRTDLSELSRSAIATSAHLTAKRMMLEYVSRAYS